MDTLAHYVLRFPSSQEALSALEAIVGSMMSYPYGAYQVGENDRTLLYMSIPKWDYSVISAHSWNFYVDPESILNASPVNIIGDSDYERAHDLLSDLEELRSFPEVRRARIHYLFRDQDVTDQGTVVDEEFLSGLWNLTRSRF